MAEAGFFPGMDPVLHVLVPQAVPGAGDRGAVPRRSRFQRAHGRHFRELLQLDGALGLAGWQWLYVVEALPSILLAFAVLAYLTDRPAIAKWLEPDERDWLDERDRA